MLLIQQLTSDPLQQQSMVLADGSKVTIQLYFRPMQFGWFFNSISYGSFLLQGIRVTNNPDILYQWRNQIPFGIACYTVGNREPSQQEDFSSGASKLFLLTEAEVEQYREFLENGT
jgi:hypothetical protein